MNNLIVIAFAVILLHQSFKKIQFMVRFKVMVFNVTFNNISAISWRSVLLVEETVVPGDCIMYLWIEKTYNYYLKCKYNIHMWNITY